MSRIGDCIFCPEKHKDHLQTKRSEQKGLFTKTYKNMKVKSAIRRRKRFPYTTKFRRFCHHENKSVDPNYKEYKKSLVVKYDYMSSRVNTHYNYKPHYAFPSVFDKTSPENELNQKCFVKKPLYDDKRKEFYFPPSKITPILSSIFEDLENPYF